jgi:two-component system sensor histidine kinase KdpD
VDRHGWHAVDSVGSDPCGRPEDADTEVPVGEDLALVMRGRALPAADRRILGAFAAQAAAALEQRRLAAAAAEAGPLAEADRTRTALLAAVNHDLRAPLASATAAIASLRGKDVNGIDVAGGDGEWTGDERRQLLATVDESLGSLARLADDLFDMNRLQAGQLPVVPRPVGLGDVLPAAVHDLGPAGRTVTVAIPADLPPTEADPPLLRRIVANLLSNAVRRSPPGRPAAVSASTLGDRVEIRVTDTGPATATATAATTTTTADKDKPTDTGTDPGIGLGLALSRGLTEAMGGTVTSEDTPGGGLTTVISLPVAARAQAGGPGTARPEDLT